MCDTVDSRSGLRRRRKLRKKAEPFLPDDDVVIDILSWLPAKDVLRSRCVCKKWSNLSSTKGFIDLHFRRSFSMIMKDYNGEALLDRCWEPAQTRSKTHKLYQPYHNGILLSHNGLIVARGLNFFNNSVPCEGDFVIYNPLYRDDVVRIIVPAKTDMGRVCGVFFHPVQKEYCILWQTTQPLKPPWRVQYKILNLESDSKCRDINNPSTQNATLLGIHPVLFDKYIYWMVKPPLYYSNLDYSTFNCDIIEFDIRKEECRAIPCPVPVSVKRCVYNVNLIDIDGVASLVQVLPNKEESVEINIWTLKDDGEQMWTCCNYIVSSDVYPGYGIPKAIAFRDGELVLQSDGRLYVCNLKLGTYRKFGQKYNHDVMFFPHVMSLVSLKNCKSIIYVEEEDENNHIERGRGGEIQLLREPR